MPRLIVNADDLGRAPGINRGIRAAHEGGVVTSATLMVNLPSSAEGAAVAADAPRLGVGLHLNFCYGPPLTDVPSLLGADGRLERDLVALRARATVSDIEREARAQLARFRDLMGHDPTHLDSHQHIHSWPAAVEPVASLARALGVPVRACSVAHRDTLRLLGVACPDQFVIDFYGAGQIDVPTLAALIAALPPGVTELMCHPGHDDVALADSSYRQERETELATLRDPRVRSALAERNVELTTFAAITTQE